MPAVRNQLVELMAKRRVAWVGTPHCVALQARQCQHTCVLRCLHWLLKDSSRWTADRIEGGHEAARETCKA